MSYRSMAHLPIMGPKRRRKRVFATYEARDTPGGDAVVSYATTVLNPLRESPSHQRDHQQLVANNLANQEADRITALQRQQYDISAGALTIGDWLESRR